MTDSLFDISRLANRDLLFGPFAVELGFRLPGEIDRFVFNLYAKVIKEVQPADRLRGAIFVLEPASIPDALGKVAELKPILERIQADATKTIYSMRLDLADSPCLAYACTPEDRKSLVNGGWPQMVAQQYSRRQGKCVVWAMGVGVHVYLAGDLYLESADVIEELASGTPGNFQHLSWDDGRIVFEFAKHRLNDTSADGVWHLPDSYVLRPKPEVLMRTRLGEFLRFRLAGYRHHDEEPYVEHEGRADISLHLIDDRILIIEVKWLGCSLVATRIGATEVAIKHAIATNQKGWFTEIDESAIPIGLRQLVIYYKTARYRRAYLTIFDCTKSAPKSCSVPVQATVLDGHSPANFRVLRACVDPRSASKRAKS